MFPFPHRIALWRGLLRGQLTYSLSKARPSAQTEPRGQFFYAFVFCKDLSEKMLSLFARFVTKISTYALCSFWNSREIYENVIAQALKGMSVDRCLHNLKWCLISQSLTFFVYVLLERCRDQNILI